MDYLTILIAVGSALIYGLVFYAKALVKDGAQFEPVKFFSTLLVGAAVGVALVLAGNPLSQEAIEAQLLANAAVVALVETLVKIVWEAVKGGIVKKASIDKKPPV
jgi:hypothetical protein